MARNTIKILLAAKKLDSCFSQVPALQGAVTGEFHRQKESVSWNSMLILTTRKSNVSSDLNASIHQ